MKFHFLTIFPEMISSYIGESILKRAGEKKLVSFEVKNIRDYTTDKHGKVDERPYGGGPGMVMTPEPILRAFGKLKMKKGGKVKVIQLSPSGKLFDNATAKKMAKLYTDIVFVCGRYEGVDDRVRKILKADEYSIGPYTLTGGELPALAMTDAIARQIPGVLGKGESVEENRIASPRVYTRPETLVYKGKKHKVPAVLLGGDHKKIDEWRKGQQKA
jgi:tRNA (guanine37-N1)-methyltransferase